ncbi:heparan sulfate glucosamine 3-O-sulfotransferase 5 [Aplysia californica]|uniref:Heparan sulfate glucosamine 3-O-sulfotransferase 5 n=1 Tax=Aplysia californica TaxID=6500 RepID=A0ABM1W2Q1_APLCA|nr:heparan sulfate glucosamine 3-O-sulfotransferase 5 [Aplysia californica]XP_035828943.1 heparan sulfate glucosamine 3-O-sulfotransferase 5 [Aplysia californica]XP_035828944.1 heparan sulfate glucosamine 3-O-sulfotransferase 5 [Aplysia californica]
MKRCLCRWLRACTVAGSALLLIYLTVLQDNGLMAALSYGSQPLSDENRDSNKGFRKLLEEDALSSERVNSSNLAQRLPQCIIIGARKSGTRALIKFLELHPQILSASDEMHFFSNDTNYKLGLDWYRRKMPWSRPDQITIEKTPKYFISEISPARIHRMNSSTKLVVILRHPTTRVVSDYTQICANKQARNESVDPFESLALERDTGHVNLEYRAIQISMYHQHLARWLELFPRDQLHIVDGGNLIVNPIVEIAKVETFLGLEHQVKNESIYFNSTRGFYCMRAAKGRPERCLGANKGRKHVKISEKMIHKLNRFFRPHNERLYKLIGRRFSWR